MRVLVTDGNERSALAITRALGQQCVEVVVGAETERSLAAASKYCWRAVSYPSFLEDSSGFVASILETVGRLEVTAVFPVSDGAMSLIAQQRQKFEGQVKLPIPTAAAFEALSNKYHLTRLAVSLGIPVPETAFVLAGCIDGQSKTLPSLPVVVKPGRSIVNINGRLRKTGVHYATSHAELVRLYATIDYLRQPSLIQHRVDGEGQGVFALMNHGEPVALFAHRRLREKPPSGGVSVLRESIALPQPMAQYAVRLLEHVGWHGVAMVEFKVDRHTGVPFLMEVNGRFWGSLQLAVDAGVNFPLLLYRLACEDEVSMPEVDYKVGIKSRWLLGDLDHLLLRLFKSDAQLCLPPGSPTKLKTLTDFCHLIQRNTRYEVNRLDDLKPFYYELRQYLTHLLLPTRRGAGKFHSYAGRLVEAAQFTRRWLKSATLRFGLKSRKIYMPPPHTVSSVLFVCKGNICRSPFAASYVRAKLKEHNWAVEVFSAGLESSPGGKANPLAIDVALQHHISLAAHVTKPISDDLVRHADLIVVMELAQYADVVQKYPTARHKVFRLGEFHPGLAREIWDPYGGTHADFEFCFRMIRQCCDNLMGALGTE